MNRSYKATVCNKNTCVTVYGETARLVNKLVLTAVIIVLVNLVAKAAR